jgi:dolichol-phosphate mannosyltransferase
VELTVVIPTRNEEANLPHLHRRLADALGGRAWEVVFVDDSTDGTVRTLDRLASVDARVRFVHRPRPHGLATAVAEGFALARGRVVAVMDADLQHPPELLPELVRSVQAGADLAVASRYAPGGDAGSMSPGRRLAARAGRALALLALPEARRTSDPLSGFFACRRDLVGDRILRPLGWKILLEVLVRTAPGRVADVPFRFAPRAAGSSKLGLAEAAAFVRHVARLACWRRGVPFVLVGAIGAAVNLAAYALALRAALPPLEAGAVATHLAMAGNFALHARYTWPDRGQAGWRRPLRFLAVSEAGVGLNLLVLAAARARGAGALLAQLAGLCAAVPLTFVLHNAWTWGEVGADEHGPAAEATER